MAISVLPKRDELKVVDGRLFIDGKWVDSSGGEMWTHVNPAANEEVGRFAIATAGDVDRAVKAARRAFDEGPWPAMKARERKAILQHLVGLLYQHKDELNELQVLDNALPISFSSMYQLSAEIAADVFDHHAGWIDKITGDTIPPYTGADIQALTFREPVGVVAAIIPWNAPIFLFAQKVAPALATGCTMVMKPSEFATLSVLRLTELLEEAGLPPGVFNLVPGPGPTTGEALITHELIDKITFTGSRAVGQHILEVSGKGIKRVSLELGGKSASLNFADAPSIDMAAMMAMGMVSMGLSGQGCVCQTRALVESSIYDDFINAAQGLTGMVTFGDPFDPEVTSGPIINPRQLEKVMGYIESGKEQGARLVTGGDRPAGDLAAGNFVNPTLFADVDNQMKIAREEIFGPVLSAIPFTDEDEAIRIANDSPYGLGAGVFTTDIKRAFRVSKALRAGTVGVNDYSIMPNTPFGGYKQSGLGREGGFGSIEAFTELKTVFIGLS
ncbi:MAG: aldehyde dehydrogenase [Actinobacteria bacterium]|nr:MAG: aldehyde dehydrogenase [Actinomycetota bacterium]